MKSTMSMGDYAQLTLKALSELDGGRIGAAFELAIEAVAKDLYNRPGEKKERVIKMEVAFKPVVDENGLSDTSFLTAVISEKYPPRKSMPLSLSVRSGGSLAYRKNSEDNHRQGSLLSNEDDQHANDQ